MKKILLLIYSTFYILHSSFSQIPNWEWAKSGLSPDNAEGWSVAADLSNNAYVCGFYQTNLVFSPYVLSAVGSYEAFIAKYDANGNIKWAKSSTGTANSQATALGVSTDASGNSYLAGSFSGTVSFGSNTLASSGNG